MKKDETKDADEKESEENKPKICPSCKNIRTQTPCEHCGFVAYNDTLSCVQWCAYAKQCVGEEMYNAMMEIAAKQKKERENEKNILKIFIQ